MTYPFLISARERMHGFDPVAEGARYRLAPAVAQEIWDGACCEATDADGHRDDWQARQRFHAVAARVMARGGWLRPAAGSGVELGGGAFRPWRDERARRAGRQPRVVAEVLRGAHDAAMSTPPVSPASPALDPGTPGLTLEAPSASPGRSAQSAPPDRAQALSAAIGEHTGSSAAMK